MPPATKSQGSGARPPTKLKQRRLQGSCDICRQKKVRCDSAKMPGQRCTNCISFGSECTHYHMVKKTTYALGSMGTTPPAQSLQHLPYPSAKAQMAPILDSILTSSYQPPSSPALIRETMCSLAQYAKVLERALDASSQGTGAIQISGTDSSVGGSSTRDSSFSPSPERSIGNVSEYANRSVSPPGKAQTNASDPKTDSLVMDDISTISDNLRRSLVLDSSGHRFFGPSSSIMVVKTALDLSQKGTEATEESVAKHRREEFWIHRPWEISPVRPYQPYTFPHPSLLAHLLQTYFTNVNVYIPLLHRPTIERKVASNLHLHDDEFGGIVLGICAVASQYTTDPRVLIDAGEIGAGNEHSGGWKYLRQLRMGEEWGDARGATLEGLQMRTLAIIFLHASSRTERVWYLIGSSLRAVQELGYHRQPPSSPPSSPSSSAADQQSRDNQERKDRTRRGVPTMESELKKRVFYTLLLAEAFVTATLGRPRSMNTSDYDLDPPIECDDEYWENEDPELRFKQPEGKPSTVRFFVHMCKLFELFGDAQLAFYAVRKASPPDGMLPEEWNEERLTGFDSALNKWVDTIPDHLRWDPHHPHPIFFNQSAMLLALFYWIQILVHRPFIGSKNRATLSYTSLAICTNAARACSRIMDTQRRRGVGDIPHVNAGVFLSGIILLLNIWRGKEARVGLDERKEMDHVFKCIKVLKTYERSWHSAARFCDVLYSLSKIGGKEPSLKAKENAPGPVPPPTDGAWLPPRDGHRPNGMSSATSSRGLASQLNPLNSDPVLLSTSTFDSTSKHLPRLTSLLSSVPVSASPITSAMYYPPSTHHHGNYPRSLAQSSNEFALGLGAAGFTTSSVAPADHRTPTSNSMSFSWDIPSSSSSSSSAITSSILPDDMNLDTDLDLDVELDLDLDFPMYIADLSNPMLFDGVDMSEEQERYLAMASGMGMGFSHPGIGASGSGGISGMGIGIGQGMKVRPTEVSGELGRGGITSLYGNSGQGVGMGWIYAGSSSGTGTQSQASGGIGGSGTGGAGYRSTFEGYGQAAVSQVGGQSSTSRISGNGYGGVSSGIVDAAAVPTGYGWTSSDWGACISGSNGSGSSVGGGRSGVEGIASMRPVHASSLPNDGLASGHQEGTSKASTGSSYGGSFAFPKF